MLGREQLDKQLAEYATRHAIQHATTAASSLKAKQFVYSNDGFEQLTFSIGEYIRDLVNEASTQAKRDQVKTVSAIHVTRANSHIITNVARKADVLGLIGGIVWGIGLGGIAITAVAGPRLHHFLPLLIGSALLFACGMGIIGWWLAKNSNTPG